MEYAITLTPVLLLLLFLLLMDSYKLVKIDLLILSILFGAATAAGSYYLNNYAIKASGFSLEIFVQYVSPVIEEILKFILIFILIKRNKVGIMIDGAIHGFAIGAGFSVFENVFYIMNYDPEMLNLIIRGLGTAVMHGGCTAIAAVIVVHYNEVKRNQVPALIVALLFASALHSGYNHMLFNPLISTMLIVVAVPGVLMLLFNFSERQMQEWLELELDTEAQLLGAMKEGNFKETKAGQYILSIKDRFSKKIVFDLFCFIQVYLELSIKAKGLLLLQESGFPVSKDKDIDDKLNEFEYLKKSIGKTAILALAPIISLNSKNLWKLKLLE